MVADDFYDGKLWMDLHQQEQTKWLQRFAGVDVQQTRDVEFCPRIFRVLTIDGSVPVDSRGFIQKLALRKSRVDSGMTDVAKPGGRP